MALTVTAGDLEALRFCESDEARSIVQNIAVILTTTKGTAPGDREFGVDMSFLDLPLPVAFQSTSPMRGDRKSAQVWLALLFKAENIPRFYPASGVLYRIFLPKTTLLRGNFRCEGGGRRFRPPKTTSRLLLAASCVMLTLSLL